MLYRLGRRFASIRVMARATQRHVLIWFLLIAYATIVPPWLLLVPVAILSIACGIAICRCPGLAKPALDAIVALLAPGGSSPPAPLACRRQTSPEVPATNIRHRRGVTTGASVNTGRVMSATVESGSDKRREATRGEL